MNVELKKRSAFSLAELMVVIAIIAIISAVAFPSYRDYTVRAKLADAMVSINTSIDKFRELRVSLAGGDAAAFNVLVDELSDYVDGVGSKYFTGEFSGDGVFSDGCVYESYSLPVIPSVFSGVFPDGAYLSVIVGISEDSDMVATSCNMYDEEDELLPGYVSCGYESFGDLISPDGGNVCPDP